MKAFVGGMFGAFLVVAAFLAGVRWSEMTKSAAPESARFEMHVSADGTVTRMDRVTGKLHMVTASGADDVPERFVAPTANPAKP